MNLISALFIVIIAFSVLLIFAAYCLINVEWIREVFMSQNYEHFFSALDAVSNGLMTLFALMNMVVLLYFYMNDRKTRADNERTSNRLYWFRTVLLENNYTKIDMFFKINEDIYGQVLNLRKHPEESATYDVQIKALNTRYTEAKMQVNQFIDLARAMEEQLGQRLDDMFEIFQDEFTDKMSLYLNGDKNTSHSSLLDLATRQKSVLTRMLFDFSVNNCQTFTPKQCFLKVLFNKFQCQFNNWTSWQYARFCRRYGV